MEARVLGFLQNGPKSGWELSSTIERSVGFFWNVTQSQVYRELGALEEAGCVRDRGRHGRATRFATTSEGTLAFDAWMNKPPAQAIMRLPIALAVFFGEHVDPSRLRRFLMTEKLAHETRLDAYLALESHVAGSPYERSTLELGIAYERMTIAWLEGLPWLSENAGKKAPRKAPARKRRAT